MKTALLQLNPVPGDVEGNAAALRAAMEQAARQGAELCVTSELALTGCPPRDLLLYDAFVEAVRREARNLAAFTAAGPALVLGTVERAAEGQGAALRNEAWFLAGGRVCARYAKRLLTSAQPFDERRYFEPGEEAVVVSWRGLRLVLAVGGDLWGGALLPGSRPANAMTKPVPVGEGDVLIHLAALPFTVGGLEARRKVLADLAHRTGMAVIHVNQVGGNDELVFAGRSMVFDPAGELVARAPGFERDVPVVDTPLPGGQAASSSLSPLRSRAAPCIAADDVTPESEIWRALVLGTRDFVRRTGMTDAVLGLSGGVDSALVAAIACEALGPEHVRGVLMPSPWSSGHSITDALALARNLGMETFTVPIEPAMQALASMLEPALAGPDGRLPGLTGENIQARIRGNVLMAFSNSLRAMVLSTGNKSELSVGYCTIYGDMCGGLAVIGDVPKTVVYNVCRWLNAARGEIIPAHVLVKPPSAELRPGQTDQDSLPPYEDLDAMLTSMLEERRPLAALIGQRGKPGGGPDTAEAACPPERTAWNRATLEQVAALVARSEFKRRQAAPVLRIMAHSVTAGQRMPIACVPAYAR